RNTIVGDGYGDGIGFSGGSGGGSVIASNISSNIVTGTNNGIVIHRMNNCIVSHNIINGVGFNGIYLSYSNYNVISNNNVSGCGEIGINLIMASSHNEIDSNQVSKCRLDESLVPDAAIVLNSSCDYNNVNNNIVRLNGGNQNYGIQLIHEWGVLGEHAPIG